jgi:hypothetical protein
MQYNFQVPLFVTTAKVTVITSGNPPCKVKQPLEGLHPGAVDLSMAAGDHRQSLDRQPPLQ